ncbi:hypothetical protein [Marivirga arenosa]|uniref:Uncharacterized protein n=1 Tax=Marivirga arenosa TaxID=3059076 RepID=A0AA49GF41_9BACT|nr:hypothetical protein [Marivirga sp. BKB1-2]WKK81713.1 hypothetical protein QYS47_05530 [Marivirga sp. BKB1-2]
MKTKFKTLIAISVVVLISAIYAFEAFTADSIRAETCYYWDLQTGCTEKARGFICHCE